MKLLTVKFNGLAINYNQIIDLKLVQVEPEIIYDYKPDKYYTILMVDPDAPSRDNPTKKYYLHWIRINNNNNIVPFVPSTPPPGSGFHRYCILLFEQETPLDQYKLLKQLKKDGQLERANFNPKNFEKYYNLKMVACNKFQTKKI